MWVVGVPVSAGGGGYMGVHMCKVYVFQSVWGDLYMWVGI